MAIFSHKKQRSEVEEKPCDHWHLAPRWANAEDMGRRDRVTSYVCDGCGQTFSREEAEALERRANA